MCVITPSSQNIWSGQWIRWLRVQIKCTVLGNIKTGERTKKSNGNSIASWLWVSCKSLGGSGFTFEHNSVSKFKFAISQLLLTTWTFSVLPEDISHVSCHCLTKWQVIFWLTETQIFHSPLTTMPFKEADLLPNAKGSNLDRSMSVGLKLLFWDQQHLYHLGTQMGGIQAPP